jgi:hypothetical protein
MALVKLDQESPVTAPVELNLNAPGLGERGLGVSASEGQLKTFFETYDGLVNEGSILNVQPPFSQYRPTIRDDGSVDSACYDKGAPVFHNGSVTGVLTGPELGGACGDMNAHSFYTPTWVYQGRIREAAAFINGDVAGRFVLNADGSVTSL